MGGIAAIVDWQRTVESTALSPMLDLVPERATGGTARVTFTHAVVAESRARQGETHRQGVATLGSLAIVGDLRLWNRGRLRSHGGSASDRSGWDDRRLILEAYRRAGLSFLDDVDGDYAFVIWDDREQRVIAARDRFGMKPLFFERTPTGIRFASEPKQLVATSARPVEPCARSIAEYIIGRYQETRLTFFEGVERVRPSTALVVDPSGEEVHRYWNPADTGASPTSSEDIAEGSREQLVESVRRRLATGSGAVSHLSGGLDSSSIAAAAHVLSDRRVLPAPFHTVSAVFPGYSIDESEWIEQIADRQPFPHHDFVPSVDDPSSYEADMWISDQPRVNRIRDMWAETAAIGADVGADLVFAGIGGDQTLDEGQLLLDRLRHGSVAQRLRDARIYVAATGTSLPSVFGAVIRDAAPARLKRAMRRVGPGRDELPDDLVQAELRESLAAQAIERAPFEFDFPTLTQEGVVGSTLHPSVGWINEVQEATYASKGLELTQPYLDRDFVEFVASIRAEDRPFDGRSKHLVRSGFAEWLPRPVLNRRSQTFADEYLDLCFSRHAPHYTGRYPVVSEAARPYLDANRYELLITEVTAKPLRFATRESLWSAWTLMAWLDTLHRYRVK